MCLTGPAKDSDQFTTAPAVVADRNDIAQSRIIGFSHLIEDFHEVVRGGATREDDDAAPWCSKSWSQGAGPIWRRVNTY